MSYHSGRHFLQIPGPTNVPDRVLHAIGQPTIDHRGPEFQKLSEEVLLGCRRIFKTSSPVIIYPASGTGAWEAGLINTLSPGDKVLMFETGHFATLWCTMARKFGLEVDFVPTNWRHGADPQIVEEKLKADTERKIKSVNIVHNETSTGVTSRIAEIRQAMDNAGHPALLMVDTISSLGSVDYRHEEWKVDVTVGCSQKGLMLPPGLGFNAVSEKALEASKHNGFNRHFWDWNDMLKSNANYWYPSTPSTNLLFGLREAIQMLEEEGLDNVFARHQRFAEATRRAVRTWGLEILCEEPKEYSPVLTTVMMPENKGGDAFRKVVLNAFNMSLGSGLGKVADKVFRIGHLGYLNDLTLIGTLAGVEMGLELAGIKHQKGGAQVAMEYLAQQAAAR
ncbi:pyridoxal-phosphate-dependent aminotransferase family protein [Desulfofustis limnaeus]|uniref:Serine--glyoxylate aminotransferase n=1 Tax=Desulfofustis limnaeus TaxID=2740163 RepID=A0ABN6M6Q8_9BACT|nr:aminotransferase class V-fold PLP-dependent enzyme [Desulfofustis limnaeus]MDX9896160.1 aminotransferase class V-fold PLP-dependent enzyme [Desulfofustis sp.]BDD87910.1 serine--glyoxylate aminotransferase [Desulfofustis limnaeus]